jgi:excinuclease UvrABC nuclease subunit
MTVEDLLAVAGLAPAGEMGWSERCPERAPGVYVVTCGKDLDVDGERVQAGEIVYVGKATRLRSRLSQFSRQTFDRGSHWGGVRVLHIPAEWRRVHWAVCHEPRAVERAMIAAFVARCGRLPFANRKG